jgi:hypothetical protein
VVRTRYKLTAGLRLFVVAKVPLNEKVLAFRVAVHAFAVASELRIVWRQEAKARVNAVDEGLNLFFVAEDHSALPVRRDGAKIDDLYMTNRVNYFSDLRGWDLAHGAPLALRGVRMSILQTASGALFGILSLKGLTGVCEEYGNQRLVNNWACRYLFVT